MKRGEKNESIKKSRICRSVLPEKKVSVPSQEILFSNYSCAVSFDLYMIFIKKIKEKAEQRSSESLLPIYCFFFCPLEPEKVDVTGSETLGK